MFAGPIVETSLICVDMQSITIPVRTFQRNPVMKVTIEITVIKSFGIGKTTPFAAFGPADVASGVQEALDEAAASVLENYLFDHFGWTFDTYEITAKEPRA